MSQTPRQEGRRSAPVPSYRCVVLASGRKLSIEVRLGSRLLRTISPDCKEGQDLLSRGLVELVEAEDH